MATGLGQLAVGHRIICDILETDSLKANEVHYSSTLPFVNDTTGFTTMEIQDEDFALTGKTIYAWGDDLANPGTTTDMFSVGCNALGNFEIYDLNNGQPRITINASTGNITFNPALPSGGGSSGGAGGLAVYLNNTSYPSNNTAPDNTGTLLLTPANYTTPQTSIDYSFVGTSDNGAILVGTFTTTVSVVATNLVIPAGIWDLNIYTQLNQVAAQVVFWFDIFYVNGGTEYLISSGTTFKTDLILDLSTQLNTASLYVPTTTVINVSDLIRIKVYIQQPVGNTNGHTFSLKLNDSTISHLHTSIISDQASTIDTTEISSAATYYPTMVSVGTGNPQGQILYTDTGISFDSLTNNLTATTFTGALTGTATNAAGITLTIDNAYTGVTYIPYSKASSGNQALYSDTGLVYNPNNNQLTATTFNGNATLVNFNTLPGGGLLNLVACGGTTGGSVVYPSNITYAPGTGTITTTTFAGNLTGNASTATIADLMISQSVPTGSGLVYVNLCQAPVLSVSPRFVSFNLTYDHDLATLYCTNFDGLATRASVANMVSPQATPTVTVKYLTFVEDLGIDTELLIDKFLPLTYTPSSGTLSSAIFSVVGTTGQLRLNSQSAGSTDYYTTYTTGATGAGEYRINYGPSLDVLRINKNGLLSFIGSQAGGATAKGIQLGDRATTGSTCWQVYNDTQNLNLSYQNNSGSTLVQRMTLTPNALLTLDGSAAGVQFESRTAASTDYWTAYSTGATGAADLFFDYNGSTRLGCSQSGQVDVKGSLASVILADRSNNADPGWVVYTDNAILNFYFNGDNQVRAFNTTVSAFGAGTSSYNSTILRCCNSSGYGAINLYNTTAKVGMYYTASPDRLYACNTGVSGTSAVYLPANALAWSNTSDRRAKNNIVPIPSGSLDKILKLNPVSYKWNDPENDNTDVGFIAQEVIEVIPEVVDVPENPETDYYGITPTNLIPFLVKAVQELSAKVSILEQKLNVAGI